MGDAALKLARRALASGGPDSNTDALGVLKYYVERENGVAQDTRVWAAMLYLYGQIGDHHAADECQRRIDHLRGAPVLNRTPSRTPVRTPTRRRAPEPQRDEAQPAVRVEHAMQRSRTAREKSASLFDSPHSQTKLDEKWHFPAWKSRLLAKTH